MKGIGRLVQLGITKETVRGTAETTPSVWLPFTEASADEKITQAFDDQAQGVVENTTDAKIVQQYSELSLKGYISDKSIGYLLLSTLGTVNSAANSDAGGLVKDHTFTVAQSSQHQSLTYFLNDPISAVDYKYALGCIDELDISYATGKLVEFDLKIKAKKGVSSTLTPATSSENVFKPSNFALKLASTQAGLTAATAIAVKTFKLKIIKGLESDNVLGSLDPVDYLNKTFEITGEIEAIWQNEADFKTAFIAGTEQAMRIDLLNSDVTIGTAAKPELQIDLYKVSFNSLTRPFKVGDVILQTIAFTAHYSLTDSKMISAKLTNLQTAY